MKNWICSGYELLKSSCECGIKPLDSISHRVSYNIVQCNKIPHRYLYFDMWLHNSNSYASSSIATCRASDTGQVKEDDPSKRDILVQQVGDWNADLTWCIDATVIGFMQ